MLLYAIDLNKKTFLIQKGLFLKKGAGVSTPAPKLIKKLKLKIKTNNTPVVFSSLGSYEGLFYLLQKSNKYFHFFYFYFLLV